MAEVCAVCCLCGDVGFPDKLFRCTRCRFRLQHSYCSNYYNEGLLSTQSVCDWCVYEELGGVSMQRKEAGREQRGVMKTRRESDGTTGGASSRGKTAATAKPTGGRRYKLLKDVLC